MTPSNSVALGGATICAGVMSWDLRQPCADCPFLKSSPFHEGVCGLLPDVAKSIMENQFAHTCHKTDTRDTCDGPVRGQETGKPLQHCAGALLMLLKTGRGMDLQLPLLKAMETGKLSGDDVRAMTARAKRDSNVFTFDELLAFYQVQIEQRLRPYRKKERAKQAARHLAKRRSR